MGTENIIGAICFHNGRVMYGNPKLKAPFFDLRLCFSLYFFVLHRFFLLAFRSVFLCRDGRGGIRRLTLATACDAQSCC